MSAYLFNGMDEWWEKNKGQYSQPTILKQQPKLPRDIHYGDEYNRSTTAVKKWNKNGHTITLWSDGNLTCDCNGWKFKRHDIRECIHVREIYGELTRKPTPPKSQTKQSVTHKVELSDIISTLRQRINEAMK